MTRTVELIDKLPLVYRVIEEYQQIMGVETPIINSLWQNVQDSYLDTFIITSTEYGIKRREQFLGMPVLASDDLETRRFKLLARYQEQAPYTWRVLRNLLNSLLGDGQYELTRNVATKSLEVKLELAVSSQVEAIEELLERILPANMVFTVIQRYNTYAYLSQFTYGYLSNYTYQQVREEEL